MPPRLGIEARIMELMCESTLLKAKVCGIEPTYMYSVPEFFNYINCTVNLFCERNVKVIFHLKMFNSVYFCFILQKQTIFGNIANSSNSTMKKILKCCNIKISKKTVHIIYQTKCIVFSGDSGKGSMFPFAR